MTWYPLEDRRRPPRRLTSVLTPNEVQRLPRCLTGDRWLVVPLLSGAGWRLLEALRLRVKDVDCERGQLTTRETRSGRQGQQGMCDRAAGVDKRPTCHTLWHVMSPMHRSSGTARRSLCRKQRRRPWASKQPWSHSIDNPHDSTRLVGAVGAERGESL